MACFGLPLLSSSFPFPSFLLFSFFSSCLGMFEPLVGYGEELAESSLRGKERDGFALVF